MHARLWSEKLNGRDHFKDLGVDRSIILKRILEKSGEKSWTRLICLRIGLRGAQFCV